MTDSIRVPLGDQWRHVPHPRKPTMCAYCRGAWDDADADYLGELWPCDAEQMRVQRDDAFAALDILEPALDAATARALAAEEALAAAGLTLIDRIGDVEPVGGMDDHEYRAFMDGLASAQTVVNEWRLAANRTASGDEG